MSNYQLDIFNEIPLYYLKKIKNQQKFIYERQYFSKCKKQQAQTECF